MDWECAERHTCQKSSLHGSFQDDKLEVLLGAWPRLSESLQAAIVAIFDSPELALRRESLPRSEPSSRKEMHYEQLAHLLAHRCRSIIQSCFREEEWIDIDQEFFTVILDGIRNCNSTSAPKAAKSSGGN